VVRNEPRGWRSAVGIPKPAWSQQPARRPIGQATIVGFSRVAAYRHSVGGQRGWNRQSFGGRLGSCDSAGGGGPGALAEPAFGVQVGMAKPIHPRFTGCKTAATRGRRRTLLEHHAKPSTLPRRVGDDALTIVEGSCEIHQDPSSEAAAIDRQPVLAELAPCAAASKACERVFGRVRHERGSVARAFAAIASAALPAVNLRNSG